MGLLTSMGGGPGDVFSVGGKQQVFEPEAMKATVEHFEGIMGKIAKVRQHKGLDFASERAALDFASRNPVLKPRQSAESLFDRFAQGVTASSSSNLHSMRQRIGLPEQRVGPIGPPQ